MKYLVTGGTGYIGAHLVRALVGAGHEVHALVRNVKKAEAIKEEGVVIFEGSFCDAEAVKKAVAGCDGVYHLGGNAAIWEKDVKRYFDVNVEGTKIVCEAAMDAGVERVVFTSSAGVLGPSVSRVVVEDKSRDLDFFNEYESSKALAESLVKTMVAEHGLDAVIVSPTRVFGPYLFGEPASVTLLIDRFVKGNWRIVPGDGSKVGNYVYVADVVRGHMLAMEKGAKGVTYILGGENHSYNDFFEVLKQEAGKRPWMIKMPVAAQMWFARFTYLAARIRGKVPVLTTKWVRRGNYHWEVDPSKAVRDLGLEITPLREGIKKTVSYSEGGGKQQRS